MVSSRKPTDNNAGEDVEKRQPYCTVAGNINWYSYHGKQYGDSFNKLGIKLPYDPARVSQVVRLVKTSFANAGDYPWLGTIPWRREYLSTPVSLPGKPHGQRNLEGYSP